MYIYTFYSGAQIEIYASIVYVNNLHSFSDDRLKHDELDISNGLVVIRQLEPKSYIKDDVGESGVVLGNTKSAGFIAQDIEKLEETKEFVSRSENTGFLTLDYNAVFTFAVAAIKEMDLIV